MSRRINWGDGEADAKYITEDTGTPGDFVVAEDTDGNTVLLKYDDTAGEWVYGGPVNMGGSDISNVGQLSSTSVNTDKVNTGQTVYRDVPLDRYEDIIKDVPEVTQGHVNLYLDPLNGDDSNPGTEAEPIETLSEAQSRTPMQIRHGVRWYLADGDYRSQEGFSLFWRDITIWNEHGFKIIGHHPANPLYSDTQPSNVILPNCHAAGCRGTEEFEVIGVRFDDQFEPYDSIIRFRECHFTDSNDTATVGRDNAGVTGYMSRIHFVDCDWYDIDAVLTAVQMFQTCKATLVHSVEK